MGHPENYFGDEVRRRRRALNLTHSALGALMDPPLSQATIADIERHRNRSSRYLLQLAKALGCDAKALTDPKARTIDLDQTESREIGRVEGGVRSTTKMPLSRKVPVIPWARVEWWEKAVTVSQDEVWTTANVGGRAFALAQSPDHEDAFRAAARLLRSASAAAKELADEQAATASVVVLPPRPSRLLTRRIVLGGAIAAAAGYVMIRPPLDMWPSIEELSADYRTGKGEQRKVMLAPDISVELNTQNSLALRPTPNGTRVELISGEASVIARRSSSTPLVMLARDGRISALQADFNARCLDGVVSVTCLDGIVTVEQDGRSVQLRKAEQVTYSPAGLQASLPVDARQVAAWQTGLLISRDRPLASASTK